MMKYNNMKGVQKWFGLGLMLWQVSCKIMWLIIR